MRIDCAYPPWVVLSKSKIREHGSVLKVGPALPWIERGFCIVLFNTGLDLQWIGLQLAPWVG